MKAQRRIIYRFIEWLCCFDEWHRYYAGATKYCYRIVRIKAWNWFLVDEVTNRGSVGQRMTISPVWNWARIKHLLLRPPMFVFRATMCYRLFNPGRVAPRKRSHGL